MKRNRLVPSDMVVRCIAMRRNGYWVAMCVDLDLAVQADTIAQARRLLREQICSYVDDALSVDAEHASVLLKRRAPWRYVAMYYASKWLHLAKRWLSFEAAMPVKLAKA